MHTILILGIFALIVYILLAENPPKWLVNPSQRQWLITACVVYTLAIIATAP